MLCLQLFCATRFKSGRLTGPLKFFLFRMAEIEFKQKSNWIRSCNDGCGLLDCEWDLIWFPKQFTFLFQSQAFLPTFFSRLLQCYVILSLMPPGSSRKHGGQSPPYPIVSGRKHDSVNNPSRLQQAQGFGFSDGVRRCSRGCRAGWQAQQQCL
jgi:hypothetical protein